ncbi:hypothetical protein HYH03_005360 [Edaphochlamys debaryana]|uniref:Guanylate cyclase domain-containing protein n=1 Tax=Edaphochlamys debaryana TaxID=47281 RepID=A0A835Y974_9CHLO|nr:hypothetical protein HYH03_005360 [Edaphochlamys debaryana]|eukprot:KAG2496536.1 hypothetical protein HYH03_005360 [Edaphochlamys debaryana]
MAAVPGGAPRQQESRANGPGRRERAPGLAPGADDADEAASILEAWDRARAAQDASVHRGGHRTFELEAQAGDGGTAGHEDEPRVKHHAPAGDELLGPLGLLARHQASPPGQAARLRLASTDGRKGLGAPAEPSSSEASPSDRVRRAKQRRNSYSVPQTPGLMPADLVVSPGAGSVSQQSARHSPAAALDAVLRPPARRNSLQDLQLELPADVTEAAARWNATPTISPGSNHIPSSPPQPTTSQQGAAPSSGQHAGPSADGAPSSDTGIRKKLIKMMSLQRTKQRAAPTHKGGPQAPQPVDAPDDGIPHPAETDSDDDPVGSGGHAHRPLQPQQDSDEDDVDVRGSVGAPHTAPWAVGGVAGPSPTELRMMGANNSVSFKKSTMKQGVLRPLATLPPFVPRLFIEDITLNHDKYRGFDAAGRDLTAASKSLQPSIIELQASVMIADVTGFTKLTEILSKKGTSGVELLTTCMNNYFTRAINMIMAFEGDVVKFAGDSMIVLFYPNEIERRHPDKGLRACTLRMMACSHQLASKLGHMRMKMNGQVEPAPPPTPEPMPLASVQIAPASAQLPVSVQSQPMAGVPSTEVESVDAAAALQEAARNNSGPVSGANAVAQRRVGGRDSPRSSVTNPQVSAAPGGEEGSVSGADAAQRALDSGEAGQGPGSRKRGKSWNLMANLLKGSRGAGRRSEVNMTPGSMSPAGGSSSGPSRASFDKGEPRGATRMSARERAKTETGLGLALRSGGGNGSGGGADGSGGGAQQGGGAGPGLWAGGEGVVRRELSVATKLNLPPPLRPMTAQRPSLTLSPLNATSNTSLGPTSAPLASGVYPGSGGALASLANTGTPASGSPRSFTEQQAASGGSYSRRAPLGARSERRMMGSSPAPNAAGDWRSKLQNLSTAIVQSPNANARPEEDLLGPQRSRLSESVRAVRWDTVQEEEGGSEDEGQEAEGEAEEDEEAEDASYPPIQAEAAALNNSVTAAAGPGPGRLSGPNTGSSDVSSAPTTGDRSYNSAGSQSAGVVRTAHAIDLRRKLLLRASHSEREREGDPNGGRRSTGGLPREDGNNGVPGPLSEGPGPVSPEPVVGLVVVAEGPGPVAEGAEDGAHGRGRTHSEMDGAHGRHEGENKGGFMAKVVTWFGMNNRNRNGFVDSFSHAGGHQGSGHPGGGELHSDAQGSPQPSAPQSASNSFNYTTGLASGIARVPPPNMGVGSGPLGKGPRGDPIMEEVSNSRLSLKVMTSAGSVCVFHVGGGVDEVTDPTLPEVPRWEFFIGDRPLAPELDSNQRRRCISQVAAIEDQATAGSVVASAEVVELVQGEWELLPLPDTVWRVLGPAQPGAQGSVRLSHTSLRTSGTSHTPHLRSSDVGMGLVPMLPLTAEVPEAPQGAEEDLVALQAMRAASSVTNQQATSAGQASSALAVPTRSVGNSLNGSSDRPTNGSSATAGPHPPPQPQSSLLGGRLSHSDRLNTDAAGGAAGMERTHSGQAAATAASALQSNSQSQLAAKDAGAAGPQTAPAAGAQSAAAAALAAATHSLAQLPPRLRHEFVNQPEHVQRRIAGLLRMHVLGSVRIRVEAGHLDFINEIRPLTCMFLGFPSLLQPRDDVPHKDQVSCVQFAYTSVQAVMRKWDGSFLQFRSDEKGFVGICAFGLPGHTHEDNPTRGIRAALELASTIKAGGHTVAVGVTTGDLLCTCVGARKLRSEYTVFGDAINLSARLMVKCKKDPTMGSILCDEPTYLRAKYQASFIELEPLPVKGKAQPVLVYRVGPHDATAEAQAAQQRREAAEVSSGERPLIGRDAEMTLTLNHAASMISGMSHGGIIIIEGNTGMGKTKLLMEVRKSLERINADTSISSRPAFHMVFGMADTANKSQKLHPWRRVFQELFSLDLKMKHLAAAASPTNSTTALNASTGGGITARRTAANVSSSGQTAMGQGRRRGTEDGPGHAVFTALGERLCKVPNYDTEWRQHLAELLDLPPMSIPLGSLEAEVQQALLEEGADGLGPGPPLPNGVAAGAGTSEGGNPIPNAALAMSHAAGSMMRPPPPWKAPSARHASITMSGGPPVMLEHAAHGSTITLAPGSSVVPAGASEVPGGASHAAAAAAAAAAHNTQVGAPIRKNSLNFLVHVMQEFISLYGPSLVLLENLHDFDTWSWQLLVKAAEVLTTDCMILATTRPNDLPAVGSSHHLHGKAALYQKVAMMYRHLLKLPSATRIVLEPFNFHQTKSLMQVVADINYPDQYVLAVMEKTGGMPLYIEKVTEFLCQSQRPWLPDQGGEFSANVNKMIRNLNFQQVIIERMDRLKPGIHLSLKVASVMGQWVDLDILHKFYPINKSKEELRGHLQELERGNFLKPTDAEGVWEFNMVERDIVYEVIPHYQRRRLHAKLAQELEKSLEEQHVATLTTIAYHWNQACMGHEVTEVECSLKAIEFWHRAAEAAYSGSSLMEALKLYQKAAQIAEILAESMGGSVTAGDHAAMAKRDRGENHSTTQNASRDGDGTGGGTSTDGRIDGTDQSFTAVGSAFKGQLNWALISRLCRSQWEKSMASCCLGIVLQHRYEFNTQLEYWDTEDYFRLLTEHAIRGLMLLGAPHPKELLSENTAPGGAVFSRILCCFAAKSAASSAAAQHGWHSGLVLQDVEVQEIRDILLVLIIAAEHYSLQHDGGEYTRLLTFCKRVCKYFNKCSDSGTDPFLDIRSACSSRIKNYKASRAMQSTLDFGISQEPALEAAAARNAAGGAMVGPELSRAVLGLQQRH